MFFFSVPKSFWFLTIPVFKYILSCTVCLLTFFYATAMNLKIHCKFLQSIYSHSLYKALLSRDFNSLFSLVFLEKKSLFIYFLCRPFRIDAVVYLIQLCRIPHVQFLLNSYLSVQMEFL